MAMSLVMLTRDMDICSGRKVKGRTMGKAKIRKIAGAAAAMCAAIMLTVGLAACSSSPSSSSSSTAASSQATTASQPSLSILYEKDDGLINNYSLLAVNPNAPFADANGAAVSGVQLNTAGAKAFIDWMLSDEGINAIKSYGVDTYGEALFSIKDDAPHSTAAIPQATDATKTIRLSTTTSVNDSGLLEAIVPMFESKYGYKVEVYSAGTGKSIANAMAGNADVILVHAKAQEDEFVSKGYSYVLDGYSKERLTFMYNYFVICGPTSDPAGIAKASTAKDAFKMIADTKSPFISRGDKSGTHTKEISLWPTDLGITTEATSVANYTDWYNYSNAGMGACLLMAKEKNAYILSDKATFLAFEKNNEQPLN